MVNNMEMRFISLIISLSIILISIFIIVLRYILTKNKENDEN